MSQTQKIDLAELHELLSLEKPKSVDFERADDDQVKPKGPRLVDGPLDGLPMISWQMNVDQNVRPVNVIGQMQTSHFALGHQDVNLEVQFEIMNQAEMERLETMAHAGKPFTLKLVTEMDTLIELEVVMASMNVTAVTSTPILVNAEFRGVNQPFHVRKAT